MVAHNLNLSFMVICIFAAQCRAELRFFHGNDEWWLAWKVRQLQRSAARHSPREAARTSDYIVFCIVFKNLKNVKRKSPISRFF